MPVPTRRRDSAASTVKFPEMLAVETPCVTEASKAICSPACAARALSALVNVPAGISIETVATCWARVASTVENSAAPLKSTASSRRCLCMLLCVVECVIGPRTCPLKCTSARLTGEDALLGQGQEKITVAGPRGRDRAG
ncbi:hypothetical protein D3C87_1677050 [compost metagenome]